MPNTEIPPFLQHQLNVPLQVCFNRFYLCFFILEAFAMASTLSLFKSVFSSAAKLDRKFHIYQLVQYLQSLEYPLHQIVFWCGVSAMLLLFVFPFCLMLELYYTKELKLIGICKRIFIFEYNVLKPHFI